MPNSPEYQKAYMAKLTPEKRNQYNRVRNDNRRAWFRSLKTPCIVCGEDEPCVIDFHHLDESTKEGSINRMRMNAKKADVLKEIEKCVTLCSNCHRKVHAGLINLSTFSKELQ